MVWSTGITKKGVKTRLNAEYVCIPLSFKGKHLMMTRMIMQFKATIVEHCHTVVSILRKSQVCMLWKANSDEHHENNCPYTHIIKQPTPVHGASSILQADDIV